MDSVPKKGNKKRLTIVISIVSILIVVFVAGTMHLNDYYPADMEAIESFTSEYTIEEKQIKDGVVYVPDEATKGFIFIPVARLNTRLIYH